MMVIYLASDEKRKLFRVCSLNVDAANKFIRRPVKMRKEIQGSYMLKCKIESNSEVMLLYYNVVLLPISHSDNRLFCLISESLSV